MATLHAVPGRIPKPAPRETLRVVRTTDSPNCTGAWGWLRRWSTTSSLTSNPRMKHIIANYGPESMLLFNQVVGTSYVQKGAQIRMASVLGMSFATAYDYNGDISMGFTQTLGIDSVECESKSWGYARYAILWSSNVLQRASPLPRS